MPRLAENQVPRLRRHKSSGLAVVTLSGHDFYCGPWGDEETPDEGARRVYERKVAEWLASGRHPLPRAGQVFTVGRLCQLYPEWAAKHYRKNGRLTRTYLKIVAIAREVSTLYGDTPASEFGPMRLKAVREQWVRRGLSRQTCNDYAGQVKSMVRWAVEQELTDPGVLVALKAVRGLQQGRTEAPDRPAVGSVDPAHLVAILPHVPPAIAAMFQLMDLTGMRPCEAIGMRPCDVDRSAEPWRYTVPPRWNKTFHKGRARVVMLGPKARAILAPWLDAARAPDAAVFRSPIGRSYYTRDALWLAIRRAAVRAGVPPFGPGRLRHSAGSRIRAVADLETARAVLGHSDAATTLVYAEADQSKAAKIAEEMG